ncbi:MAG TPA: RraA family protein [Gemmataceae bacterium]|nr:RraA family protein [Gemmataceae bacterium]
MPNLSAADLDLLRRYDTPTICNVIELFDIRPRTAGYMDSRITACFPKMPPAVGFASTATYRSAAAPRAGDVYSGIAEQVESFAALAGPALVVIQDLDDPPAAAVFGEVMCTTYKTFGAVGLVTNGAGRDLDQVEALDFPVFTGGTNCSHGYCHIPAINLPVRVGGAVIYPGDLLHADRNGVTTIPIEIASAVAHACAEFAAAEAVVLDYLKAGRIDSKSYAAARNECRDRIEAMAQRLRVR